jgi:cytochrome c oxidase cbb3-type subunit 3
VAGFFSRRGVPFWKQTFDDVRMNFPDKTIGAVVCTVLVLSTIFLHEGQAQQPKPAPKSKEAAPAPGEGKKIFESICASCHGLDGRGGERGPNIATAREVQNLSDSEVLKILRDGKTYAGMPGFAGLGNDRLGVILKHLRKLQGMSAATVLAGNPANGKALFFGKADCASCHMIQGRGGYMGSDLSEYGAGNSPNEIREAILQPNKDNDPRQQVVEVATEGGQNLKGIRRNEDNFSLQLQTLDGAFHLLQKSTVKSVKELSASLMPGDYGSKLTRQEIDDLIHYLISVAKTGKSSQDKRNGAEEDED